MVKNMFKILYGTILIVFLLVSCSDSSTGPEEEDVEFTRDFHLIVTHGANLLDNFPDTVARIDSAFAYDMVLPVQVGDTIDFMEVLGGRAYILKEELGRSAEDDYHDVIDPGEKIFSVRYPIDFPWVSASIEIFVSPLDTTYYFEDGRIETFCSPFFAMDTTVEHGIQTKIYSTAEIEMGTGQGISFTN